VIFSWPTRLLATGSDPAVYFADRIVSLPLGASEVKMYPQ
jgi:hypothetical protein